VKIFLFLLSLESMQYLFMDGKNHVVWLLQCINWEKELEWWRSLKDFVSLNKISHTNIPNMCLVAQSKWVKLPYEGDKAWFGGFLWIKVRNYLSIYAWATVVSRYYFLFFLDNGSLQLQILLYYIIIILL
jgi:hypothetical protein